MHLHLQPPNYSWSLLDRIMAALGCFKKERKGSRVIDRRILLQATKGISFPDHFNLSFHLFHDLVYKFTMILVDWLIDKSRLCSKIFMVIIGRCRLHPCLYFKKKNDLGIDAKNITHLLLFGLTIIPTNLTHRLFSHHAVVS